MNSSRTAIIAEDQALMREALAEMLTRAGFEVVAQAATADDLLRRSAAHRPDLVVTDVRMPPENVGGLRAAVEIRRTRPETRIVVLSQYIEKEYAIELLADGAGGVGYMLKDRVASTAAFLDAIEHIMGGGSVVDPGVVAQLMGSHRGEDDPIERLTERERSVLELMAEGRSNRGIAEQFVVTDRAIEKHVHSIFAKLDLAPVPEDHRRVLAVVRFLGQRP